jgi:hypothetical protein
VPWCCVVLLLCIVITVAIVAVVVVVVAVVVAVAVAVAVHSLFILLACFSSLHHSCTLHRITGNIEPFQFPGPSKEELTPKNGIGRLLLPRRDLIKKCCDELIKRSQTVSGRNSAVSAYWRGPKGSGKTTFLHLMGREMQDRDCQVFYLNNAADFNETDRTFVRSLSENRSEYEDTVVVMIDEVQGGVGKGFWVQLMKEFETKNNPHELYIAYHFQSELSELVDELHRHFPENTREQLAPFCERVNSYAGGHMFPTLKLCEHLLQIPDWPDHYQKALRSSDLVNTEAYIAIRKRCFDAALPSLNTFVRFLRHNPTLEDIVNYEKPGLWDQTYRQFVSPLYFNLLWNSSALWAPGQDIELLEMLPANASAEEKIEFIIKQGLAGMEKNDFLNPYAGGGWSYEEPIGNMWALRAYQRVCALRVYQRVCALRVYQRVCALRVYQRVCALYISTHQTQQLEAKRYGVVLSERAILVDHMMRKKPCVDFVFSGSTDVAVELLLTGVHDKSKDKAKVNKQSLRFSEKYKQWENSCALFTIQLTGDDSDIILPTKKDILNYTFVHELNSLYKGKELVKRGVVSKLRTPPQRRDFSTWSAARPMLRGVHVVRDGGRSRAALGLGYSLLKRFR